MGFKCGIVGMPNVGKSTLFNALTNTAAAEAANFPFCTIEPNVGRVAVPDDRLFKLAEVAGSGKIIPTQLEFVDIAGLVKGASKGEGLGNKFLAHIREVDVVVHLVRCFDNEDITHVEGKVDPVRDIEIIETELILADLESITKRVTNLEKKKRSGDKESTELLAIISEILPLLNDGKPARMSHLSESGVLSTLNLLTSKPVIYVCNMSEDEVSVGNDYSKQIADLAQKTNSISLLISARIEEEIANLDTNEEKSEFLEAIGLSETGLSLIIRSGYSLLDLTTFFTIGPKEAHAWTVKQGSTAPEAAGVIHTDFQKGFIRAETISYEDYVTYNGEQGSKEAGKMRLEGKEYISKDGDIFHFRFNV